MTTRQRFIVSIITLVSAGIPLFARGQSSDVELDFVRALTESKYGILSNSIANLEARGDSLWIGPYLNLTTDGGFSWQVVDSDSLFGSQNRVFSLDASGDVVVVGLGRNDVSSGDNVQAASGFLVSSDGGATFEYHLPQLDQPTDTTVVYGQSILGSLAVIVPQQSPPFDIHYDGVRNELWVAGWASGIRKSTDLGKTWNRVVLPPDYLDAIHPDSSYTFRLEPRRGGNGSLNHMGFGVLVDSSGDIWAGTAGGVNLSQDGGSSWRRFRADGSGGSLTGSWVISIEEQRFANESVIWMATWNTSEVAGEQFGVTFTTDSGVTFRQALHGERIYDFAFDGTVVYAAGENGLFISEDGGIFWTSVRAFQAASNTSQTVRSGVNVFSVERVGSSLWVGTSDGLLKSNDGGATWRVYRTDVPLHPDEASDLIPDVDTYAYPNPFSPASDGFVRIKYALDVPGYVTVRLFDFGMNLVRTLREFSSIGTAEIQWDGLDSGGTRLANGAYFYEVRAGSSRARGKILVIQ